MIIKFSTPRARAKREDFSPKRIIPEGEYDVGGRFDMVDFKGLFNDYSDSLIADFQKTTRGNHKGLKGGKREEVLKNLFEEYFPVTHGVVCRGELFDNKNNISDEMDVIVYNTSVPVFKSDKIKLFPIESIYGVCQVKTELDSRGLKTAAKNIQSAKKMILPSTPPSIGRFRNRIYGSVFAFDGNIGKTRDNLMKIYEEEKIPMEEQIDLICVLGNYIGLSYPQDQGLTFQNKLGVSINDKIIFFNTGKDSLAWFLPLMMNGFNKPIFMNYNIFDYMQFDYSIF